MSNILLPVIVGSRPDHGKQNWKMKQASGVVEKEISAMFVIDTHCETRKFNNVL
jgi:hypothetical protein